MASLLCPHFSGHYLCVPAEDCVPEGCEGEGETCPDLSWYQTGCYWVNMFNACSEDTEGQV